MTSNSRKWFPLAGAVLAVVFLFLWGFLPWKIVSSIYDKSRKITTKNLDYSTRPFPINGVFVKEVNISVTSEEELFHQIALHVYPRPPPLDVHKFVNFDVERYAICPGQVFCTEFYLNVGSVVNMTFCVDNQTRLLIIKGSGDANVNDFDNIKSPFRLVRNEVCGPVACQSGSDVCKANITITSSNSYRFCFEGITDTDTVHMTNITYAIDSLQYNLSATTGKKCIPLNRYDGNAWCDLPVPNHKSAMAILEIKEIATLDFEFVISTDIRQGFIWGAAGSAIGCTVLGLCGLFVWRVFTRCSSRNDEQSQDPEGARVGLVSEQSDEDDSTTDSP